MKPITEHPEFKKQYLIFHYGEDCPKEAHQDVMVRNGVYLTYKAGAEITQSILQKEHEEEIIAFTMWYISWIIDNDMKFHHGKDGEIYTIERLLQNSG